MKSDFTYHTIESQGINILVIIDLDQGGASVTNNAEAVVKSIAAALEAFCKAERVTLAGSTIPASIIFTYSPL